MTGLAQGAATPFAAPVWIILANLIAMLPSRDHHWRAACGLIAAGIPILGWLTLVHGPTFGLVFLAAGASVLRWPVWTLWPWLTGRRRGERFTTDRVLRHS